MVKGLATELRLDGIRVNSLAPGVIRTNFADKLLDKAPEGSVGVPDQIGSVAACICSRDGSFMNGEITHANGGFHAL